MQTQVNALKFKLKTLRRWLVTHPRSEDPARIPPAPGNKGKREDEQDDLCLISCPGTTAMRSMTMRYFSNCVMTSPSMRIRAMFTSKWSQTKNINSRKLPRALPPPQCPATRASSWTTPWGSPERLETVFGPRKCIIRWTGNFAWKSATDRLMDVHADHANNEKFMCRTLQYCMSPLSIPLKEYPIWVLSRVMQPLISWFYRSNSMWPPISVVYGPGTEPNDNVSSSIDPVIRKQSLVLGPRHHQPQKRNYNGWQPLLQHRQTCTKLTLADGCNFIN